MTRLRIIAATAWAAVAVLVGAVAWVVITDRQTETVTPVQAIDIGGPFALIDQREAIVTEAALKGHPSLMFFGYTFCPDVCPTTLADITMWLEALGPEADGIAVYFVTVDPERDTPEQLGEYLSAFDPRIVGLTGARPAIDKMLKSFAIYAEKVEGDHDSYLVDHTASVFLLDSEAKLFGTVAYTDYQDVVLAKLRRLIAAS